jgi:hypothetical protein
MLPQRHPQLGADFGGTGWVESGEWRAASGEWIACQFVRRRLAADLVEQLPARAHDLLDRLDHVHRDADGALLIGDRLPDPPCRVGRELVAAAVLELVDLLHQADVAFQGQIEELQAAVGACLGDRDDEAQVRLHHLVLGLSASCPPLWALAIQFEPMILWTCPGHGPCRAV